MFEGWHGPSDRGARPGMQQNFMWQDVRSILLALPLFAPFLLAPGYAAGFLLNVFNFRKQRFGTRLALSLTLSFCITPISSNLLGRLLPTARCAWLLLALSLAAAIACLLYERFRCLPAARLRPGLPGGLAFVAAALWILICLCSFPDLQVGHRLWSSVMIYDDAVRDAFIDATVRTGVPPHNPLCFFGAPITVRYYYYWSTVCALPASLAHLPAQAVFAASAVWTGFALAAMVGLFLRFFLDVQSGRSASIGVALLAVTGLDLIPTLLSWFTQGFVRANMEWWDGTEIPSWLDSLLWTPHHVASLLCCLTVLLLLAPWTFSDSPPSLPARRRIVHIGLATLALASALGLSVYIFFPFALFLFAWCVRLLFRRRWQAAAPLLAVAPLALLLSLPLLGDLSQPAAHHTSKQSGKAAPPITTGLRTSGWVKGHVHGAHLWRMPLLLADLATTYLIEFGFLLLVTAMLAPTVWRRRHRLREPQIALGYLLGVALFVLTFLRSEAINSNDLGMRVGLVVEWILLLAAIPVLDRLLTRRDSFSFLWQVLLGTSLLLGVGGTVYELALLRFAEPVCTLSHRRLLPIQSLPVSNDGFTNYQLRSVAESLRPNFTPGQVVAFNPFNPDRLQLLLNIHTQVAASFPDDCGTSFGGSQTACDHSLAVLREIYGIRGNATPVDQLWTACRSIAADVLLVQPSDPVWRQPTSWVWQRSPVIANPSLRAIRCSQFKAGS